MLEWKSFRSVVFQRKSFESVTRSASCTCRRILGDFFSRAAQIRRRIRNYWSRGVCILKTTARLLRAPWNIVVRAPRIAFTRERREERPGRICISILQLAMQLVPASYAFNYIAPSRPETPSEFLTRRRCLTLRRNRNRRPTDILIAPGRSAS